MPKTIILSRQISSYPRPPLGYELHNVVGIKHPCFENLVFPGIQTPGHTMRQ